MTDPQPKPKRGRPPKPDGRHQRVYIRVTAAELAALQRLAAEARVTVSEYVRTKVLP
jgi:hypothetical protein